MIGEYYQRKNTHLVDWQMCKTMHFQGNTNKKIAKRRFATLPFIDRCLKTNHEKIHGYFE